MKNDCIELSVVYFGLIRYFRVIRMDELYNNYYKFLYKIIHLAENVFR